MSEKQAYFWVKIILEGHGGIYTSFKRVKSDKKDRALSLYLRIHGKNQWPKASTTVKN